MIYKVKSGFRLKAGLAQVVGEECERLESEGRLTPRNLVEASRPEDAPLHGCFEWDDTAAAERWRDAQAAYIIRSVEVSVTERSEPTRAFVAVVSDGQSEYRSVGYVLRDAEGRDALLEAAKRELVAFTRKYRTLSELAKVIDSIEEVIGSQAALDLAG